MSGHVPTCRRSCLPARSTSARSGTATSTWCSSSAPILGYPVSCSSNRCLGYASSVRAGRSPSSGRVTRPTRTRIHRAFAGDANPAYHGFDPVRYVIAMEDLADLRIWRGALNDGEIHVGVAEALGTYVARIAFHTSDLGMDPEDRKRQSPARSTPSCAGSPKTSC